MQFKMTCPKCLSHDYSVERDRRATYQGDANSGLVFSCRCGKQLFGDQVMAEHDRQLQEHEASRDERVVEQGDRDARHQRQHEEEALRRAMSYRSAAHGQGSAAHGQGSAAHGQGSSARGQGSEHVRGAGAGDSGGAEPSFRSEERSRGAGGGRGPTSNRGAPTSSRASSIDDDEGDGETCAWHPCNNPPRDSSKYCCRACSNKNARWRHKQRKREDQEAA